jgi:hypothetical protein
VPSNLLDRQVAAGAQKFTVISMPGGRFPAPGAQSCLRLVFLVKSWPKACLQMLASGLFRSRKIPENRRRHSFARKLRAVTFLQYLNTPTSFNSSPDNEVTDVARRGGFDEQVERF